ncbi:MAG: phytanoyl-CoA dioxygenase family protein [Alphaproteobacteria bacterium]|nr:phytanoyl-CoA dioxygenase family protein [Alphaproteobacteria bacterium]
MSNRITDNVISGPQVDTYREKGFVVVEDIFSADDIEQMRAALDELTACAKGLTDHTNLIDLEPGHTPEVPRVRRIKDPCNNHPVFQEMARRPRLINALTALLGPDLRLHGSKINLKSADHGSAVEWHQDWAFYPHTNDDVLAVGVMLDDMTPENGPLLCLADSHRGPTYDHHQDGHFVGAMDPTNCALEFSQAEMITGSAGSCSFHHVRAVHGSASNTSARDRRLLLLQVAAADAWDLRGMEAYASWENHEKMMLAGSAGNQPRIVETPVRLPYPGPLKTGSIYESQTLARNKYFADKTD